MKTKGPFTHAVWSRYRHKDRVLTGWFDQPRMYRSEKSADMAAKDLNEYYSNKDLGNFVQHIVLPIGEHPTTNLIDGLSL